MFKADGLTLLLVQDVKPLFDAGMFHYDFVLTAVATPQNVPVLFVTLERSALAGEPRLCTFNQSGAHGNYGSMSGKNVEQEFVRRALEIVSSELNVRNIRELGGRDNKQAKANLDKPKMPPEAPRFGSPEWAEWEQQVGFGSPEREQQMREEVRRRGHRKIERDSRRIERELLASVAPPWQRWAARAFFLLLLTALLFGLKWLFFA